MVSKVGRGSAKNSKIEWLIFSEHQACTVKPDVAQRNRDGTARFLCFAEYNSLDQIRFYPRSILKPSPCGRRDTHGSNTAERFPRRSGYSSSLVWTFQTNQFEAIPKRLPRIHLPFHKNRSRRN